jgi:hypothetical protein
MLRWWNGGQWTNDIRPLEAFPQAPSGSGGGLRPVSDWLTETFRLIINHVAALFTLLVILLVPASLISALGLWYGIRDLVMRIDENAPAGEWPISFEGLGPPGFLAVALVVNIVLTFLFTITSTRLIMSGRFEAGFSWNQGLTSGLRSFLPVLGWSILAGLAFVGFVIGFTVVAVALGFAGAIGVFLVVVLALTGGVYVFGRYVLAFTSPMVAAKGQRSVARVHQLTKGRVGGTIGRVALLVLVSIAASLAGSLVTGPLAALGGGETFNPDTEVIRFVDLLGGNLGLFLLTNLMNTVVSAVSLLVWHVGLSLVFEDLGGGVDPELRDHGLGAAGAGV